LDRSRPFTVCHGDTVAVLIRHGMVKDLKSARICDSGKFNSQQLGKGHVVADRDMLELHV
jgi:uncharacterized protein